METRFGVLAVPETYKLSIDEAARLLQEQIGRDVTVAIGANNTLMLYIMTKESITIPETWKGFQVKSRYIGKVTAFSS